MRRIAARFALLAVLAFPFVGSAAPAQARCTLDCLITHGCILTVEGWICY